MSWWAVAISAADKYSPWALNAKAESAYKQSWAHTHDKQMKSFNAEDSFMTAEANLARINNDKQLATTQLHSERQKQLADLQVNAAATGNTGTMVDVGTIDLMFTAQQKKEDMLAEVDSRRRQEISKIKSSAYEFYTISQPYKSGVESMNIFGLK